MRLLATILLAILFLLCAAANYSAAGAAPKQQWAQQQQEKKEIKVWVNTNSGVYHCPGTRWYGATKQGKYMGECEAIKAGYRPAYKKPCGSSCK